MQQLLDLIAEDVRQLPLPALQLVGALVALQDGMPDALQRFLMDQLGQRTDLSVVSPAAEAVMRLSAFSAYSEMEFAALEIRTQMALLKAIAMEDKVLVAAAFMSRLAERVESAFVHGVGATLQPGATVAAAPSPPAASQVRPQH
jgi:hypothetical protein